jgi:ribosome-associated heat shock protein Hsp15
MANLPSVRIDKWLWAARFFKTRSLATEAIDAGHVRKGSVGSISGDRLKPAHIVQVGDVYAIQRGDSGVEIVVTAVSDRRGSATEAALLFEESLASISARTHRHAQRTASSAQPVFRGRPTKQDRRKLAELFAKNYAGLPHPNSDET